MEVRQAPKSSEVIILSNRLPVRRVQRGGTQDWESSPGGLVSALSPVVSTHSSTWVGWTGVTGTAPAPFKRGSVWNVPVSLTREDVREYYEGFSNRTLWPLYHDSIRIPEYRRDWWDHYVLINQRFADKAAERVRPDGTVWVHDFHLQLVPAMLRYVLPKLRIGFFLHIPFPPGELFSRLPWRTEILHGLLGADVVGFQTPGCARNFIELADRFTSAERARGGIQYEKRLVQATDFPISIDVDRFTEMAESEDVRASARRFRARLAPRQKIMLGVDRLDYTKGIDVRLEGYRELLRSGRVDAGQCVLVQVAVPSREYVPEYQELRSKIEGLVGEINGDYGELASMPIHYLHRSFSPKEIVSLYLAADVMLVTPLRDGMNLVAKEYVASRVMETGALVLSEFAGAARELRAALMVNPHDIEAVASAMETALSMPHDQQKRRMRQMKRALQRNTVFRWARNFYQALTE